jgi:hypothetical protein
MKKLLLFVATIVVSSAAFGQSTINVNSDVNKPLFEAGQASNDYVAKKSSSNDLGKSTGLGDTLYRVNQAQYDSLFVTPHFYYLGATLPFDSGYVFGVNALNYSGFAGRFKYTSLPDTTMKVIGVLAAFSGTYNPATSKSIDIKVWGLDPANVTLTPTRKMTNLPGAVLATMTRSIKTIGINNTTGSDTIKEYYFPTAASGINTNFFVGYEMAAYQWPNLGGDTICAYSCLQGTGWGHGEIKNIVLPDTFINAQTAMKDGGVWKDSYMQIGFNKFNISIVPIFQYSGSMVWPSSVAGVNYNNLTFYGHYPNPATNNINIRFSVAKSTSVSVLVRDITGKTVMNVPADLFAQGEHTISLETSGLPAGNYVYMVRTAEGDAMAAQMTITK